MHSNWYNDLECLRCRSAEEAKLASHLNKVLKQKHSFFFPVLALGFSVFFYGYLPWQTWTGLSQFFKHALPLALNGLALWAVGLRYRDGIYQGIRRPHTFEVKGAQLMDAKLREGVRFETVDGKRRVVSRSYNPNGSSFIEAHLRLSLDSGEILEWKEQVDAWTWNLHYTTDTALMQTSPPDLLSPHSVQFPIAVWVLYRATDTRGWLVGIPDLPRSKWLGQ